MTLPSVRADEHLAGSAGRQPHPALRGLVGPYVGYRYLADPPSVHHGLPATTLTMVLAFGKPIDVGWLGDPLGRQPFWSLLSGLGVEPASIHQAGEEQGVQVEVTPLGARVLFGLPAAAIRREMVSIDVLPGQDPGRLHARLADARSWDDRFDLLDDALLHRMRSRDGAATDLDPSLRRAWHLLHRSGGRIRVADLAEQVGWSRRRLHERFDAEFGVSPKQTSRLVRLGVARGLLLRGGGTLADVAYRSGFADQAHLCREWRTLSGVTATDWLAEVRSIVQDGPVSVAAESVA